MDCQQNKALVPFSFVMGLFVGSDGEVMGLIVGSDGITLVISLFVGGDGITSDWLVRGR